MADCATEDCPVEATRSGLCKSCYMIRLQRNLPFEPIAHMFLVEGMADTEKFVSKTGVHPRTYTRWKERKAIPLTSAEKACAWFGIHPTAVWGDLYYQIALQGKQDECLSVTQ